MKLSVFNRGTGKLDQPDDIYVERIQMDQGSSIIKSSDYFVRDVHQLIVDGEDFQMIGQYMFVTKKVVSYFKSSVYVFFDFYDVG
jgi:hypothetical protein